jgi:hypothetical protein
MTDTTILQLQLDTTNKNTPPGVEVWVDDTRFYDTDWLIGATDVVCELNDDESSHTLKIVLKNKKPEHTTVDDSGNIVDDTLVTVNNIQFDGIDIGQIANDMAKYHHNFNNNGPDTVDKFNNHMGCNGTVTLNFSTPVYLWLLENM